MNDEAFLEATELNIFFDSSDSVSEPLKPHLEQTEICTAAGMLTDNIT
jgi:hypothetical protein